MNSIDISTFNRNINYSSLKSSGAKYIYIKATEGVDYVDPMFTTHTNEVKNTGIAYGYYHFMSERTDPAQQANDFWKAIKNTGFRLIPVLDIENNNHHRSAKAVTDRVIAFLNQFKKISGYDCIIYTGAYFGRDTLDSRVKNYPLWVAQYDVSSPTIDTGFKNVVGHQYSCSGSVNGVPGKVDMSNFTGNILISGTKPVAATAAKPGVAINTHLRDFQSAYNRYYKQNIAVDGLWGKQSANAVNNVLLKFGARGDLVAWVQIRIGTAHDGIFGPDTRRKVISFQQSAKIGVDGIVGPNTIKAILRKYRVKNI